MVLSTLIFIFFGQKFDIFSLFIFYYIFIINFFYDQTVTID